MGKRNNTDTIVNGALRYAALAVPTAAGLAMVFVPGPQMVLTVPAGIAILYATYKVSERKK